MEAYDGQSSENRRPGEERRWPGRRSVVREPPPRAPSRVRARPGRRGGEGRDDRARQPPGRARLRLRARRAAGRAGRDARPGAVPQRPDRPAPGAYFEEPIDARARQRAGVPWAPQRRIRVSPGHRRLPGRHRRERDGDRRGSRPERGQGVRAPPRRGARQGQPGGADRPVAATGEPRPARRWRRPRLQQPARGDPQLRRVRRGRARGGDDGAHRRRRDRQGGRAGHRAHAPAADLQPPRDRAAGARRSQRGRERHRAAAAADPWRARRARRRSCPGACRQCSPIPARSSRCW